MTFNTTSLRIKKYFRSLFTKKGLKNFIIGSSVSKRMFRIYFLILILFSILLYLPISFEAFQSEGWGGERFNFHYENNHYVMNLYTFNGTDWQKTGELKFNFFDCLFTAFSAFSDTGFSLAPTYQLFSTFGIVVLLFLIQIGGFGVMFFIFLIWRLFNRMDKLSINQALLAQSERGTSRLGDTQKMIIKTAIILILIQIIFGLFYSLWFLLYPAYIPYTNQDGMVVSSNEYIHLYKNSDQAFLAGFFHSITSLHNAGFDIISDMSLAPYRNDGNAALLIVTMIQFIIGGIGFPVIYDIFSKIKFIKKTIFQIKGRKIYFFKIRYNKQHRICLFTKICLTTYFFCLLISIFFIFLFEATYIGSGSNIIWNDNSGAFGPNNNPTLVYFNKSMNLIFQAASTRSAGFATFNNSLLDPASKWMTISMMFIGGSPSSTAGGIRVTTFAILMFAIWTRLIGRKDTVMFKRSISDENIKSSFIVTFTAIILVSFCSIVILSNLQIATSTSDGFTNAMFVSTSAFGTVGLSSIDLTQIDPFSKLVLMIMMFIGQYGISSTLLMFRKNKIKKNSVRYIKEDVRVG